MDEDPKYRIFYHESCSSKEIPGSLETLFIIIIIIIAIIQQTTEYRGVVA